MINIKPWNKLGLKAKTIISLGTLLLFALLAMGGSIYYQAMTLAINELLESTGKNIEKDTSEIETFIKSSKDDLMVISDTPPVQGILRAKDNGGIDPLTKDKTEYWFSRMEQIFGAFLKSHPEYFQLRYLDENGDEITRVDQIEKTIRITPRKELQNKAQYPYFKETVKLKQGEVYYSEVNLNREDGGIQVPHTPVFRIATPVYDAQKRVRGVVVVNIFAEAIFSNIRTAAGETKKYVINQDGYFLVHPDRSKEFGFDLGFDYRITAALPEFAAEMKAQDFNVKYHTEEKHIDGFKKIFFDPGNKDRYWAVAHEIPVAQAFKNINLHRNTMLVVGLLIIVLSLVIITWTSTKKIVTPILKLSEAVNSIEKGDLAARVQEDGRHDEIGELGSSINRMAGIIEKNVNELTILNRVTVAVSSSLPAPVMATNALDAILELHLLKFEKKAALFMADEKTRTLRLVASRGLSEEQKELDAVVPFGDCLCGSAAETGEPVLSERCCDDPRHTRKYTEITPHGHLILPLKAEGKVLGVLVLYLEADTRIKPEETKFYQSIADIISMSLQNALSFSNIEGLKRHQALILDSVGEGIYGLDNSGICTFMNPTSAKLLGYEKEELIGKRLHDITHHTRPDGSVYPHEECKIYASFKDNAVYHSDDELFWRKDGSSFPVGYISTPIQDKAGNAIGAVVVFSDTTERKQAEERERNRSRILESLTSGVSLASILELIVRSIEAEDPGALCSILLLDDEGKHLLHGAAPSLPDFYSQAIHGLEIGDGVGSCGTAAFTKQRVIAADVLTHPYWADFRDLAQKANLRSCWSEPILSAEDRVLGTFAIYHRETGEPGLEDIERIKIAADFARLAIERKKAEYKIKEYAETLEIKVDERTRELNNANIELKKLFNAIEQSDESIVITDMNGSIQYVNPVFTRRTGYSREEVIGRNPRILQSGLTPVEVYDDLWKTLLSGRPWKGTLINKKKSGELYYEDATIAPVFDEQGNITNFVAAKADVTDRIMAEKELKNKNDELAMAKEEAEAANKAKSDFLANMSHELRTPLNAIIGFSEILEDGMAGPIADNQKELANDIATSGKHLLSLINDILDLSKVEAGKMELELSEFNLEELIDGSLVMFKEKAMKHNIKVAAEVEAEIGNIIADERKIKQVLFNLLSNAMKFTPEGGAVSVRARRVKSSALGVWSKDRESL